MTALVDSIDYCWTKEKGINKTIICIVTYSILSHQ